MVSAQQKFGKYIFLEEQESSVLGSTWRAAELAGAKIDHNLLADILAANLAADIGFRDQFIKQSTLSAKLEHPNILRKLSTAQENGEVISFYEYQEGFSLEKVIKRCQNEMNPFSVDHALLVVSKLLSALAYAKTKHLTHGFVNPSMIFVTHEGEIKLKGFSFSSAMRSAKTAPAFGDYYRHYTPPGLQLNADDRDRMDIYGCGAILFEMLVGEPFKPGGNVASIVGAAETADGEAIAPKIAAIVLNALDETRPGAYKDIQKMAKDMDELLFSGEYSPTTFNLAFFMHSAFRVEMEELGEKIAAERNREFVESPAVVPAKTVPSFAATIPVEPVPAAPVPPPRQAYAASAKPKSKMPLVLGVVAALLVVVIAAVLLMPKPKESGDTISQIEDQLSQEGKEQDKQRQESEIEELRRQNEQQQALLREQAEAEMKRKQDELETEMADVDKRIAEAKRQKEANSELQKLQAENERLKKMMDRQQEQAKKEEAAATPVKPKPRNEETAASNPAPVEKASNERPREPEKSSAPPTTSAPAPSSSAPVESLKPPQPGELVLLSDEQLRRPELLQTVPKLDVPRKARDLVTKAKPAFYIMRILINDKGVVEQAMLERRSLAKTDPDYGMEDMARDAAMKTKWSIPTKQGVPVRVWSYVTITFFNR